jgi:hypothetical protein
MLKWERIKKTALHIIKWTWVIAIILFIILWLVKEMAGIKAVFV